jgi:hypothetical protein
VLLLIAFTRYQLCQLEGVMMFDDNKDRIVAFRRRRTRLRSAIVMCSVLLGLAGIASADVNQDGVPDLLWRNSNTGDIGAWLLSGPTVLGSQLLSWPCGSDCFNQWKPVGALGHDHLLWHNASTGQLASWVLSGATVTHSETLSATCGPACASQWKAVGTGDFHQDGVSHGVLWHNASSGELGVWLVNGATVTETPILVGGLCDTDSGCAQRFHVVGVNRHGAPNILWFDPELGTLLYWVMAPTPGSDPAHPYYTTVQTAVALSRSCAASTGCSQQWTPIGIDDVDGDGQDDVVWFNATSGEVRAWLLDGFDVRDTLPLSWQCAAATGCSSQWQPMGFML